MNAPKWSTAFVGVALTGLIISGCSSGGSDGPVEIRFTQLWTGDSGKIIESIVDDFNASQDEIVVRVQSNPDITQQLASMTSSDGNFDVSDGFGTDVVSWASKGILYRLDDAGIDVDDFLEPDLKQMSYEGSLYAVPFATHSYKLVYNKALFAEAGIEQPPTTMDELADAIARLTKQDADGTITQLGLGSTNAFNTLTTLGFVFGGQWDADGAPSPEDPRILAALDWYQENVTDRFGADNIANFAAGYGEYLTAEDPFYTGKVAMILDGEWQAVMIPDVAPDLEWGVADIPAASPQLANATQIFNSTFFVPANARNKDAAVEFLRYMTGPEAMKRWTLEGGDAPARKSLLADPAYDEIPGLNVWLEGMTSPSAFAFDSAVYTSQYMADLTAALQDMTLGSVSPEDAMARVSDAAKAYPTSGQ